MYKHTGNKNRFESPMKCKHMKKKEKADWVEGHIHSTLLYELHWSINVSTLSTILAISRQIMENAYVLINWRTYNVLMILYRYPIIHGMCWTTRRNMNYIYNYVFVQIIIILYVFSLSLLLLRPKKLVGGQSSLKRYELFIHIIRIFCAISFHFKHCCFSPFE